LYCAAEAAPTDLKPQWSSWFNTMVSAVLICRHSAAGIIRLTRMQNIIFPAGKAAFLFLGIKAAER